MVVVVSRELFRAQLVVGGASVPMAMAVMVMIAFCLQPP